MKKYIILLVWFAMIIVKSNAQDLEVVTGSLTVTPLTVHIGENLEVSFTVTNSGVVTAGKTYTGIYLSTSGSLSGANLLSEVSLQELGPGENTLVKYKHPIPYNVNLGNTYLLINLNNQNTITETNTNNNLTVSPTLNIATAWAQQNLLYPIIFIHGYNGNNTTWDTLITFMQNTYGYSYGGKMDFCLNYDSSNTTAELFADFHDFTEETGHTLDSLPCDMYTINFENNPDGSYPYNPSFLSNQAGAFKQGYAVKKAIEHVLSITGKDKVMLVCHSMGGLAARVYLQEPNWNQADNKKHVSKLCTIGTPHGGSDFGSGLPFGLNYLYAINEGYDLRSEAIRDLRTNYFYSYYYPFEAFSTAPGVLLFGGLEELDYMNDQSFFTPIPTIPISFYNADVDCDGNASGATIPGLNYRNIPADINYSCLIGIGEYSSNIGNSDGIVTTYSQNLNNYRPVSADIFEMPDTMSSFPWHTELTKQVKEIILGMDEPNSYLNSRAYLVSSGQLNCGNITYQPLSAPPIDKDCYNFLMPTTGILSLEIYNIPTPIFSINIFNSTGSNVFSLNSNGKSYLNIGTTLPAGNYYIVLSGIPTIDSWKYPYSFVCTYTPSTSTCISTTVLTASSGVFSDGSAGSNYNNNTNCKWKIQPSGATSITLNFNSFELDISDTLIVYDGGLITSPVLAKFTGSTLPLSISSSGGTMLVRFISDSAITNSGWEATYTSVVVPTFCNGGNVFTTSSGSFTDGSDTSNYSNNSQCSWLILPANALSVTLDFTVFNIDTIGDFVNVYDGLDNSFPLLGTFTGNSLPPSITSTGGALFIEFLTDDTITRSGWRAAYTSILVGASAAITEYEYWYDDDYANAIITTIVPQQVLNINSPIPTYNLPFGLHVLNVRFKDTLSKWSSVISKTFYKENILPPGANYLTKCQYWFDDDYVNRVDSFINTSQYQYSLSPSLPVSNLSYGLHTFNVRFLDNNDTWSSILSKNFFKLILNPSGQYKISNYRYWFDNDTANLTLKNFAIPQAQHNLFDTISTSGLINGSHIFHIQFQDELFQWSAVLTDSFQITNCINNPIISGSTMICAGTSTNLSAGAGFSSYLWSDNSTSQTISVSAGGLYAVTVTDINGCTGFDTINISILSNPIPTINGNDSICDGGATILSVGSGYYSYSWSTSDTLQSISANIGGNYSVTVTDSNGCTGVDSILLFLFNLPSVNIIPSGALCDGGSISLDAGSAFSSYLWSTNNTSQTITINQSGTYYVTVSDINSCLNTDTIVITSIIVDTSVTLNGISFTALANNATYQWIYCDSIFIPGATSATFNATRNGSYSVIITQNGCIDTSSCYQITTVGNSMIGDENKFVIFPNPTNSIVNIIASNIEPGSYDLEIFNVHGQKVFIEQKSFSQQTEISSINVGFLPNGMYLLSINDRINKYLFKLIIFM